MKVIKEFFESIPCTHRIGLEISMKCSDFIFDYANFLYHKCHKIKLIFGESYISSPLHIKKQKGNNNPFNIHNDKCFHFLERK